MNKGKKMPAFEMTLFSPEYQEKYKMIRFLKQEWTDSVEITKTSVIGEGTGV